MHPRMPAGMFNSLLRGASLQGDAATLDVRVATRLGRALGTFARRRGPASGPFVVATSPAVDGRAVRNGLVRGLLLAGHDVCDLGCCGADVFSDGLRHLAAWGGVFIAAALDHGNDSSSPDAASLVIVLGGRPLLAESLAALLEVADGDSFSSGQGSLTIVDRTRIPRTASAGLDDTSVDSIGAEET